MTREEFKRAVFLDVKVTAPELDAAIDALLAAERERCAKIAKAHEECGDYYHENGRCPQAIASEILETPTR